MVANNLRDQLHNVITAVSKIKAHVLNSRLFQHLWTENYEDFESLLLYTEARWLSKGYYLRRFYHFLNSCIFSQDSSAALCDEIRNITHDITYLSGVFANFKTITLELQGNEVSLIKITSPLFPFLSSLQLFKCNIARHDLFQFPSLSELQIAKREEHTRRGPSSVLCTPTWAA